MIRVYDETGKRRLLARAAGLNRRRGRRAVVAGNQIGGRRRDYGGVRERRSLDVGLHVDDEREGSRRAGGERRKRAIYRKPVAPAGGFVQGKITRIEQKLRGES